MRLAPLVLYAAALAAPLGCSSPVPASPDAAYLVHMSSAGGSCNLLISPGKLGVVDSSAREMKVTDQMSVMGNVTSVTCTVKTSASGSGFDVNAYAQNGVNSLQIIVTGLSPSSTQMAPAAGNITFLSPSTSGVAF